MGGKRGTSASSNKVGPVGESIAPAALHAGRVRYDADELFPKAERLTIREAEALERAAEGKDNADIAASMGTGKRTVETYISQVLSKLYVHTRAEAIALYHHAKERLLVAENDRLKAKIEALEAKITALRRQLRRSE
ncbi:MAG TPA: LuxR C-terminal-related transcriptional regulator [Chthoniobacterales bacterium]|nr:LuxR C-terminal-related transcriptional regulator [Chthoniobacterales bacterium]